MFKEMREKLDKEFQRTKTNLELTVEALGMDKIIESAKVPEFDFDKWYNDYTTTNGVNGFEIKFVNESNNPDPEYATDGASGFDIRAYLPDGDVVIASGEYKLIDTGLRFEIPESFELQVRSRSGLAAKHGVAVLNGIGTIDADYRGRIMVILINHGSKEFKIENGDRIAQGVIAAVSSKKYVNMKKVDKLSETERGSGGLGSTGIK
jgi:dUTP pyrophosphatase